MVGPVDRDSVGGKVFFGEDVIVFRRTRSECLRGGGHPGAVCFWCGYILNDLLEPSGASQQTVQLANASKAAAKHAWALCGVVC